MAADPHRSAGCKYQPESDSWPSQVDWAVYHAPGFEAWQELRASMVGMETNEKLAKLRSWWTAHSSKQDVIRILNYTRSLRGQWGAYPAIRQMNESFNRKWAELQAGGTEDHGQNGE